MFDVIIVGAGPAGLSAALLLGRCRRQVLVCDAGRPRNAASHALHGFLTRDGLAPDEFLRMGREELRPYNTVTYRHIEVTDVSPFIKGFEVTLADGTRHACRKLILATGVIDEVPALAGIERFYGRSVHHCPYCDAWEKRDQPLAAYGRGEKGSGLALMLKQWSPDVSLCTDGPAQLSPQERERLTHHQIRVLEDRIERLEGNDDGQLERVVLVTGETFACYSLFFNTGQHQRSPLIAKLQCELTSKGGVATGEYEDSRLPGLYVAGDASRDVQLIIIAAAEGATAAFAINKALMTEDGLC